MVKTMVSCRFSHWTNGAPGPRPSLRMLRMLRMPRCRHPSDWPPRRRRRPRSREAQRPRGEPRDSKIGERIQTSTKQLGWCNRIDVIKQGWCHQRLSPISSCFKWKIGMMNKVDVIKEFLDEEWGHILNILIYRDNWDLAVEGGCCPPKQMCQSPAIIDPTYPRGSLERTSEKFHCEWVHIL